MSKAAISLGIVMPEKTIGMLTANDLSGSHRPIVDERRRDEDVAPLLARYSPEGHTTDAAAASAYGINSAMLAVLQPHHEAGKYVRTS